MDKNHKSLENFENAQMTKKESEKINGARRPSKEQWNTAITELVCYGNVNGAVEAIVE